LIAGLILSSFHHDNIRRSPQYRTKRIDNIHDVSTKTDIISRTKSQNSILLEKRGELITVLVALKEA
jgi:hypothetical protein